MKKYISNAFSLQMLDTSKEQKVIITPVSEVEFNGAKTTAVSAVGHQDTAAVLGVPFNRMSLKLEQGDELFVAQLVGGRLPEGCTELPQGFKFTYLKVTLV
ncbi:STIV orfB116 family protein [Hoylesella shahii]|jgi:hypothetical protein|uniref:STIV orfB116 family protein n=1 Tax=Hoylesella shahii TaxID=228603 RepID=UPI002066C01E|nr:DUF1874 domain-containing protein [Hoylesella shahii]DAV47212.1 MAG TPA: hypothetical protein [Caudoviricetes sp.]